VTGAEYVYTITEDPIPGYTTHISDPGGSGDKTIKITNISQETISVEVMKDWIGPGTKGAKINLLNEGVEIDEIEINDVDNTYGFADLYKYNQSTGDEFVYIVTEDALPGYATNITGNQDDGFLVVNYNSALVDIPVKVDLTCDKATSVDVNLLADGVVIDTATVNEGNGWMYTFNCLPKYDPKTGEEIVYTVEINGASGDCDIEITGDLENGFKIVVKAKDTAIISDGGLPKTGDVSYLIGASVMIAGAGVLVVTRKR
ncbi:MAG: Cna B-type domain-containing protein, partial [Fusobacteria bacterium]|nr:Cna B-type domain-containing protein [Fusobacteriota bacterium]